MTKAPTPTEKSKKQRDNTKTPPKTSITQRTRTDLGRSAGVTIATQLVWLKPVYGIPTFQLTAKAGLLKGPNDTFNYLLQRLCIPGPNTNKIEFWNNLDLQRVIKKQKSLPTSLGGFPWLKWRTYVAQAEQIWLNGICINKVASASTRW